MSRHRPVAIAGALLALLASHSGRSDMPDAGRPLSGIETQYIDPGVRPQDDFYQYVNGRWLAATEIPADMPAYGTGPKLYQDAQAQLRELIESAAGDPGAAPGSEQAKIADLYNSFLDEATLEQLGATPLASEFARIAALQRRQDIPALIAHLQQIGVTVPYALSVHLDPKDATHYVLDITQDGLGLPDRDYYLKDDATTLRLIRRKYQLHIAAGLAMLGDRDTAQLAADIVTLETALAKLQWNRADNRDPLKTYNKLTLPALAALTPGYDWQRYLSAAGVAGKPSHLIISQPSYLQGFASVLAGTPLATWKAYFRWRLLSDLSQYLSKPYADEHFAFYGTVLQGVPEDRPRWRRGVALVDQSIGQAVGRLYVAKYFSAQSKHSAELLVANLLEAYRQDIAALDWMTPQTKQYALAKLAKFTIKIGYPERWRDYSTLQVRKDDLVGNVMRANSFEFARNLGHLGKPIDRSEWDTTPQTVNAFYNPQMNEIVFPAAILRAPFFDAAVDDAANYGAIGMVIGHEISHAFDDEGSRYDGDGNLREWWTAEDHARFEARTKPLLAEYSAFEPIRGHHLDGQLTLRENIADNSGLAIAYKAYRLSLEGRSAPVIDGLSGDQRFYLGFAQAWREKIRDTFAIELIQSDPHSMSVDRVLGALVNQAAFYQAFGLKPGDRMYLPPEQRVTLW